MSTLQATEPSQDQAGDSTPLLFSKVEGLRRRGSPWLPRHCYLIIHQGKTRMAARLRSFSSGSRRDRHRNTSCWLLKYYERRGSDYVFMSSEIHSRRLTGRQPAMLLTDYYWLVSSLLRYFGPKSGGTFEWASSLTEIWGDASPPSPLRIRPCYHPVRDIYCGRNTVKYLIISCIQQNMIKSILEQWLHVATASQCWQSIQYCQHWKRWIWYRYKTLWHSTFPNILRANKENNLESLASPEYFISVKSECSRSRSSVSPLICRSFSALSSSRCRCVSPWFSNRATTSYNTHFSVTASVAPLRLRSHYIPFAVRC